MLAGHSGNYARFEIEKKYRLTAVPHPLPETYHEIKDVYLPGSSLRLRIVRSAAGEIISRNLTKKEKSPEGDASVSIMTSLYLSENDLRALGPLSGGEIEKTRYFTETENSRVSIDIFKGRHEGLILAEVEFKTEESRDNFIPPAEWGDVTGEQQYSCGFLALSNVEKVCNDC